METVYGSKNNRDLAYVHWEHVSSAFKFDYEVTLYWQVLERRFVVKKRVGLAEKTGWGWEGRRGGHLSNESTPVQTFDEALSDCRSFMNKHDGSSRLAALLQKIEQGLHENPRLDLPRTEIHAALARERGGT